MSVFTRHLRMDAGNAAFIRRRLLVPVATVLVLATGSTSALAAVPTHTTSAGQSTQTDRTPRAGDEDRDLISGEVDDDTIYIVEEYRVDGDTILQNGDTPIPAEHQKRWDRFVGMFPAALHPEVDLFVGIDTEKSGGTDGAMQVSAFDDEKRYLALDVSGAVEFNELTRTMIHEMGHLFQLRPSQVPPDRDAAENCDVYGGGEGCPIDGAYLRDWSEAFYPGQTDSDFDGQTDDDIADRYSPEEYVTEYAATNPAEDNAEIFAEWMLLDAPEGESFEAASPRFQYPVTGTNVVDDKLRFWDDYPEMVALRDNVRSFLELPPLVRDIAGVQRLSGSTRLLTAIAVSKDSFDDKTAGAVLLSRADAYPDAVTGAPLAKARNAPLLLTPSSALDADVEAEIVRVLAPGGTVYVLGGEVAIGTNVASRLETLGFVVKRLAGDTRIDTAIAIANELGNPNTIMITTGFNFADALSAGAAAAEAGAAVLLTTADARSPATDAYLATYSTATVFAVGGPAARPYPEATAVFGETREDTAVAVATRFFTDPAVVGVARSDLFPDGLAGGAHIGRLGGPVLLTSSTALSPAVLTYLCTVGSSAAGAYVYGGPNAIGANVASDLSGGVDGSSC